MSVQASVPLNAVAPQQFQMNVTPGTSGLDLTTVTSALFNVRRPDGTATTWTATKSGQTTTTLTLTHVYVSGDVSLLGLVSFAMVSSATVQPSTTPNAVALEQGPATATALLEPAPTATPIVEPALSAIVDAP